MTCEMMDELISCYVDGALDADSCLLVEQLQSPPRVCYISRR